MTVQDSRDLIALLQYLQNSDVKCASINWGMLDKEFVFQVLDDKGKEHYFRKTERGFARV